MNEHQFDANQQTEYHYYCNSIILLISENAIN
jgi:hypothetical protein